MRVKLKYPNVDTFLQKYGPHLSRTAVFIATKATKPVGTPLRFEFVLVNEAGEQPVFRGEGVVQSVREADAVAPGRPPGMSVKFERLFGDGAELIERAVRLRGGAPPPPEAPRARENTGEVELASPQDISSGEFEALRPPPSVAEVIPATVPPPDPPAPPSSTAHVDVDALATEWQVSTARVDEILQRRRPRDPAYAAELEALLSTPQPTSISPAEATKRLAQLLDRRSGSR